MSLLESLLIIFSIIFTGFFCEKIKLFDAHKIEGFEVFLFKIAMPCYLFNATLHYDFSVLLNPSYIYSYLMAFFLTSSMVFCFFWKQGLPQKCIRSLVAGYVNSSIYTLPVVGFLLGDPKAPILGSLLQVIVIQPIVITLLSLSKHQEKSMMRRLMLPLYTPLVFMPIMGLLCNHFDYSPSVVMTHVLENLGRGVSSMALFVFGLNMGSIQFKKSLMGKDLWMLVFIKNMMHPIVAFLIGFYLFSLEGYWLRCLVIATSGPPALMVYFIAKQFSTDQGLVKMALAVSSLLSLLSLVLIVGCFSILGT